MFNAAAVDRTPGAKLMFAVLIAGLLAIPLFATYLLIFDRETQSQTAEQSIVAGWGGAQHVAAPLLVIPYSAVATVNATDNGQAVTRWMLYNDRSMQNCVFPGRAPLVLKKGQALHLEETVVIRPLAKKKP